MRLAELAGQDHAVALLRRAVAAGRVAHAYLFDGPTGVGKRGAALGFGLALICPDRPAEGCGICDVCRRALAGNHPDVRVIAPAGTQMVIDQAQEIVALASGRPHEAPARVVIVDDADRLNVNAANCLLKTLEEPFPGTHLVLVTAAPDRLLPTIRSRTQRVRFVPVRASVLVELALRTGVERTRAETAAALAGGSVARLNELLSSEAAAVPWDAVTALRQAAAGTDMGAIFDAAAALGDKDGKAALPQTLALLGRFYRDAIASACGAEDLVLLRERADELATVADAGRRQGLRPLRRALAAVLEADSALAANVNGPLALERMLMEIRPCERGAAG